MEKRALKICIILSTALTINTFAWAGTATLSWDPNAESDLAGYKAYYGTSSRNYSQSIDMGNVINYTVSGLAEGQTYYFAVTAYNSSGLESDYSSEVSKIVPVSSPSDTMPPIISGLSTSNLTSTGLTISWTTDEPADTQIEYGTSTSYGTWTALVSTLGTSHSHTLTGLMPQTLYHFRVESADVSGNLAYSTDQTFTTAPLEKTSSPTDLQYFEAIPLNKKIKLRWTNPNHPSLKGVRITFVTDLATGQYSSKPPDEILLGDFTSGSGQSQIFMHENLNNGTTYHYTASTYDEMGNFSGAVYVEATPRENEENLPGFGCGRMKDISGHSGQTNGQVPVSLAMLALAFIFMKLRRRLKWEGLSYPAS